MAVCFLPLLLTIKHETHEKRLSVSLLSLNDTVVEHSAMGIYVWLSVLLLLSLLDEKLLASVKDECLSVCLFFLQESSVQKHLCSPCLAVCSSPPALLSDKKRAQ